MSTQCPTLGAAFRRAHVGTVVAAVLPAQRSTVAATFGPTECPSIAAAKCAAVDAAIKPAVTISEKQANSSTVITTGIPSFN